MEKNNKRGDGKSVTPGHNFLRAGRPHPPSRMEWYREGSDGPPQSVSLMDTFKKVIDLNGTNKDLQLQNQIPMRVSGGFDHL